MTHNAAVSPRIMGELVLGHRVTTRRLAVAIVATLTTGGLFSWGAQVAHAASTTATAAIVRSAVSTAPVKAGWTPQPSAIDHPRGIVPHVSQGQKPTIRAPLGSLSTNPNCPSCNPPLLFHRGAPVMGGLGGIPGQVTITPVYWAPTGYAFASTYKSIINGYVQNVATASLQSTNVFSVSTQYYQQGSNAGAPIQHIQYVVLAGIEVDDTTTFPPQGGSRGCTADVGYTACVTDAALQTELQARLTALALPIDDSHVYMVLFPSAVETCYSAASCSSNAYCAYHNAKAVASSYLIYGNEPFPVLNGCADPFNGAQAPNGDAFADAEVSIFSHEANESITDWAGAWYDVAGFENGDECGYVYGAPLGSTGGTHTFYNQVIGSGKYYTQDEFSNEDYALGAGDRTTTGGTLVAGCVQRDELPTASFTSPASVVAGSNAAFNGSASSDPDNTTALSYSWNWGDGTANGTSATPSHVFASAGTYMVTLTVTDVDGWSGTVSHVITSGPAYTQSPQGNWVGTYGADGYALLGWNGTSDLVSLPQSSLVLDQGARYQWSAGTTAVQGLQSPDASTRRAACFYDSSHIRLHLVFPAAYSGTLHLYALDWDSTSRRETISINDGSGPRSADISSAFNQGAWVNAPINVPAGGSLTISVTLTAGANAVLSGIFLGGAGPVPAAPTSLTASAASSSQISLSWTGSSGASSYKIQRSADGSTGWSQVGSSNAASFTDTGLNPSTIYFYRVLASNGSSDSVPSNVASSSTGAGLAYTQSPQGNWVGTYGADGYALLGWNGTSDLVSLPQSSLVLDQGARYQWSAGTTAVQGPQSPDTSTRRAACFYDGSQIRLHLVFPAAYSGTLHLYALDWDSTARRETISINDGSGPRSADISSAFNQGAWVNAPINVPAGGSLTISVTLTAGANAVLSGIFLG